MVNCAGVILAGGQSRRMDGNNKALIDLAGDRLIDRAITRLSQQCSPVAVSVREDAAWTETLEVPIILDTSEGGAGPLAGIVSAMEWAQGLTPEVDWVMTVPVDVPLFPADLCTRLTASDADVVIAASRERAHYTVAAWRPRLAQHGTKSLSAGTRAVHAFQEELNTQQIEWSIADHDPFLNINTPDDLEGVRRLLDV